MSTVKMVALELKMAVNEDMRAANITAIKSPLRPSGISSLTSRIKATLVQPYSDWQTSLHSCGEAQATWSGNKALEAIPGKDNIHTFNPSQPREHQISHTRPKEAMIVSGSLYSSAAKSM